MDTLEHTELGDGLRIDPIEVAENPYIRIDEKGVVHLRLQRFGEDNLPEPMSLEMSLGEIIAMAGDFFTQANWTMDLDLPDCDRFRSSIDLGRYLIRQPVTQKEESALITAYNNLAAPDVSRKQIDRIYTIAKAHYIPFSPTLNFYAQQLMYYLRVKNYGEMITRNQTHFTPWSVRVYILGHTIALRYARLAFELKQLAADSNYQSDNPDLLAVKNSFVKNQELLSDKALIDLAHRYQAQAYSMELFTFHYYSDHFATGHMSMIGDLRVILTERFGVWGSILANNIHDEINRIGVYTLRPYDPTPDSVSAPIRSRGDGKFDTCLNHFNKQACHDGMTSSLKDINRVISGGEIPAQKKFGGLEYMPDVDFNSRQHRPLLILSDNKVYYRTNLSKIQVLSPTEYEILRANPQDYGYTELTSKWGAFKLVSKLRLFPYIYSGEVIPVSDEQLAEIKLDEHQRSPQRMPIPDPSCTPECEPTVLDFSRTKKEAKIQPVSAQVDWLNKTDWPTREERMDALDGLKHHSVLSLKTKAKNSVMKEAPEEITLGM